MTKTPNEKRIYLRDVLLATALCVFALIIAHNSTKASLKQKHKQKALNEFNEMCADDNDFDFKFGEHENWCVNPVEVLP